MKTPSRRPCRCQLTYLQYRGLYRCLLHCNSLADGPGGLRCLCYVGPGRLALCHCLLPAVSCICGLLVNLLPVLRAFAAAACCLATLAASFSSFLRSACLFSKALLRNSSCSFADLTVCLRGRFRKDPTTARASGGAGPSGQAPGVQFSSILIGHKVHRMDLRYVANSRAKGMSCKQQNKRIGAPSCPCD